MENPRPEKVAVVNEVRQRLESSDAVLLTEYRGMSMKALSDLRKQLRPVGGEFKVFKNTLVKFAAAAAGITGVDDILVGPTAIAFVNGDAAAAAKLLRDAARTNPNLIVKGGLLGNRLLSASEVTALADLPSRDVLLSQIAGLFEAPAAQFASLLEAVPRSFAYGLSALIEKNGGEPVAA